MLIYLPHTPSFSPSKEWGFLSTYIMKMNFTIDLMNIYNFIVGVPFLKFILDFLGVLITSVVVYRLCFQILKFFGFIDISFNKIEQEIKIASWGFLFCGCFFMYCLIVYGK